MPVKYEDIIDKVLEKDFPVRRVWYNFVVGLGPSLPHVIVGPNGGPYDPSLIGPSREERERIMQEDAERAAIRDVEQISRFLGEDSF